MKRLSTYLGFARMVAVYALMLVCSISAMADNRVYIEPFSITPGETKEVAVMMENDTPISSLQFDLTLPDGLSYPADAVISKNMARITRTSHSVAAVQRNGFVRFLIAEQSTDPLTGAIKGSKGALFTIQVTADEDFDSGDVCLVKVVGVNNTVQDENGVFTPEVINMNSSYAQAYVFAGTFVPEVKELNLVDDEMQSVSLSLNNVINEIRGLQADIVLPEGISFAENEEGEFFGYTDRLSDNTIITSQRLEGEENAYRILISSQTNDVFYGNEGALFSIFVKASGTVPADAVIEIRDVTVSTKTRAFSIDCNDVIAVTHEVSFAKEDVNRDGVVDIDDMFAVIKLVNTAEYDNIIDVNGDSAVDIDDLFVIIAAIN